MTKQFIKKFGAFFALITYLLIQSYSTAAATDRDVILRLPAETVMHTLQKALPLPLPLAKTGMTGQVLITNLNKLSISGNTVSVKGILEGNDLSVTTVLAGQKIQLKLGQVKLPVTCDFHFRFDAKNQQLFVTPTFPEMNKSNGVDPSLKPLMGALANKEYLVPFDSTQYINLNVGKRKVALAMVPVKITGLENTLEVRLQPKVAKP